MKKLLFTAYSLEIGGIEKSLVTLLNTLAKNDEYEITLVLEKKCGALLNVINKNIRITQYSPSYNKNKLISKTINALKRIGCILKFKNKYDASFSYATYCKMGAIVAQTASTNCNLWVHSSYLKMFDNNENKYKEFFENLNVNKFKNIIFVSNRSKQEFDSIIKTNNTLVCKNLIDYNKIIELSNESISMKKNKDVYTFLYIGRLTEDSKKVSRLFESANLLKKANYNFKILVIGNGKDFEKYKEMCEEFNLNDNITFLGEINNPYPYFKIADSLILVSEDEGYPVVYDEAKVLNLPIVTTDVSDSRLDIENKLGLVCKQDINDIFENMKKMINDNFIIKEKIDYEKYNNEIIRIIEELV